MTWIWEFSVNPYVLIAKIITHCSYLFKIYLHCSIWLGKVWNISDSVIFICEYYITLMCLLSSLPPISFLYISNDLECSLTTFSLPFTLLPPLQDELFELSFSLSKTISIYSHFSEFVRLMIWLVINTCISTGHRGSLDWHPGRERKESGYIPIPSTLLSTWRNWEPQDTNTAAIYSSKSLWIRGYTDMWGTR